jgi:hypothetical protein
MTVAPRPDQDIDPPAIVLAAGGAAGVFRGRLVIVFGTGFSGVFVYDPSPAAGDLIASMAAAQATDPYSNVYLPGVVGYFDTGSGLQAVQLGTSQGIGFYTAPTEAGPWTQVAAINGGGPDISISSNRFIVAEQEVVALDPVTPTQPEGWHAFTGSSGITSFDANRYRKTTDNCVEIDVQLVNSSTSVTLGTLPSAYRPVADRNAPIGVSGGGTASDRLAVNSSTGVCTLGGMGSTGVNIGFNVRIPLN